MCKVADSGLSSDYVVLADVYLLHKNSGTTYDLMAEKHLLKLCTLTLVTPVK